MALGFIDLHRPAPGASLPARGETRAFMGDGGPILVVPGLTELLGVRLGLMDIPLTFSRRFALDQECKEQVNIPWPLIMQDSLPDGTPVILRNECSNDGVFQSEQKVYVTGEWDETVPPPAEPAEKPRKIKKGLG